MGKFQDRSLLTKELWAWVWAEEHSLVWTDTADRIMRRAMDSYGWGDVQKNRWKNCSMNKIVHFIGFDGDGFSAAVKSGHEFYPQVFRQKKPWGYRL